jgi:hypothetical protein
MRGEMPDMDESDLRSNNTSGTDWYLSLADSIGKRGYFTNGIERKDGWCRTTICNAGPGVLGGNSFWVTVVSQSCFLGTWGGCLYRLPELDRLGELCSDCFSRNAGRTMSDFDEQTKTNFGLIEVSQEVFNDTVSAD